MNYDDVDNETKERLRVLVNFIFAEVDSACGDGDFLWYSTHYSIDDLIKIFEEENEKQRYKWNISRESSRFYLTKDQASINVTNNENDYKNAPVWQQGLLKL